MIGAVLVFTGVLFLAYWIDIRPLMSQGGTKHWVLYGTTFILGFGTCVLYVMNQNMPDLLMWVWGTR